MSTIATTVQASFHQLTQYYQDNAKSIAIIAGKYALFDGALVGALTSINPIGAMLQGFVSYATLPLINWAFKEANISPNDPAAKIAVLAIKIFLSISLGVLAATATGFTIPFGTAMALNLAMVGAIGVGGFAAAVGFQVAGGSTLSQAIKDTIQVIQEEGMLEFK